MGVRIIANDERAALYCSTSGLAFGPTFHANADHDAEAVAQAFLDWCGTRADTAERDPRRLTPDELEALYVAWLRATDNGETL